MLRNSRGQINRIELPYLLVVDQQPGYCIEVHCIAIQPDLIVAVQGAILVRRWVEDCADVLLGQVEPSGDQFGPQGVELLVSVVLLIPHHTLILEAEQHVVVHMALAGVLAAQVLQEEEDLRELRHVRVR